MTPKLKRAILYVLAVNKNKGFKIMRTDVILGTKSNGQPYYKPKTSKYISYTVIVHQSFGDDITDKTYKTKAAATKRVATIQNSTTEYIEDFSYCSIVENFH